MPQAPSKALPTLRPSQLLAIQELASIGLDLRTISTLICGNWGMSPQEFAGLLRSDEGIYEAFEFGKAAKTKVIAKSISHAAESGDVSAAKFWLERVSSGGNWAPPRIAAAGPIIQLFHEPARIDQDLMGRRFDRQMRLIDGSAEELKDADK